MRCISLALLVLLTLAAAPALAQEGEPAAAATGTLVVTLAVTVAALLSAAIPDEKMPKWLSGILNFVALNVGKAKNAPDQ